MGLVNLEDREDRVVLEAFLEVPEAPVVPEDQVAYLVDRVGLEEQVVLEDEVDPVVQEDLEPDQDQVVQVALADQEVLEDREELVDQVVQEAQEVQEPIQDLVEQEDRVELEDRVVLADQAVRELLE